MKTALEKLKELREQDSSIVAIAKDRDGNIYYYKNKIPNQSHAVWSNFSQFGEGYFALNEDVEFDETMWALSLVTYKDLESYEVETITISKSDYDRLIECEKKLEKVLKVLS